MGGDKMSTTKKSTSETTNDQESSSNFECSPASPEAKQPIIDTILSDVNAIIPNLSSLVASYRLLVGASEEIHRIPTVCPDVFERAVRRFDNAGTLIDILLDLLCCKIYYSSEFLRISCAPIDLFRLFANRLDPCDTSHETADQIITLEALRKILSNCINNSCLPNNQVVCPKPTSADNTPMNSMSSDISLNCGHFKANKNHNKQSCCSITPMETTSKIRRRHI